MKSPYLFVGLFLAILLSIISYLVRPEPALAPATPQEATPALRILTAELAKAKEAKRIPTTLMFADQQESKALKVHLKALDFAIDNKKANNFEIPLFPGCENVKSFPRRARCSFRKLGQFFNENINQERLRGQTGTVELYFTIPLSGKISNVRLKEDTNAHLAAELVRIFGVQQGEDIRWNPGKRKGKKVPMDMGFKFRFGGGCPDCAEGLEIELVSVNHLDQPVMK
ncbi:MAG: hypothetical protein AAGA62_16430 [Bacteroidota bacterium]